MPACWEEGWVGIDSKEMVFIKKKVDAPMRKTNKKKITHSCENVRGW